MEDEAIKLKPNKAGARKIAKKFMKEARIENVPVSLYKAVEYLKFQYNLQIFRFPVPMEKVDGLLVLVDGLPTIGFNGDQAWVRRRLTIAHEIGHLLMGTVCNGFDREDNVETEAYAFAAELLMPTKLLKADYKLKPDADFLAKKYNVSKQALCIHLIDCRIL